MRSGSRTLMARRCRSLPSRRARSLSPSPTVGRIAKRLKQLVNRIALLLCLSFLAGAAQAALPADVQRFIERRDTCEHFLGEFNGDGSERDREVIEAQNRYCKGTDKQLANLRRRYQNNAEVVQRLSAYEARIEAPSRTDAKH